MRKGGVFHTTPSRKLPIRRFVAFRGGKTSTKRFLNSSLLSIKSDTAQRKAPARACPGGIA